MPVRAVLPSLLASIALATMLGVGLPAAAQERNDAPAGGVLSLLPKNAVTAHSLSLPDGRVLDYHAEAGTAPLIGGDGAVQAQIFFTAYTLDGASTQTDGGRPITFVFNGGPGAAAAYLHLGALGPRVIDTAADGTFLPPPQRLRDNPDTWLAFTDLVFVDPVGTGYSRAAPGTDEKDFWAVDRDIASLGAFVRLYLQHRGRTGAAVWLAGESYGGFRVARMAKTLQEDVGIPVSGAIMISPALEFAFVNPDEFDITQWALALPAMASVNFERQGLRGDALAAKRAEVERWASGDYLAALAGGLETSRAVSDTVARYTGLPLDLVRRNAGRISFSTFARSLLRDEGRTLSRYDGTIATADTAPQAAFANAPDPVLDRSVPMLTSAFVGYVRDALGYRTDVSYRLLNRDTSNRWEFGGGGRHGYAGSLDDLQEARSLNPDMRVLIAHGYGDLVTPYTVSRFLVDQLPTLSGAQPIRLSTYAGGHMMYLRPDSRQALAADAAALYAAAAETPQPPLTRPTD
ncbi:S10 family peptidase [Mangrovibrevibacter kandeliae]|uniref:S10 family peptidase n=1 Tax=Mangrovibrevibacter kandeliae TaxID=2968473 RepID=UPI002117FC58|nr:peptidase S10 [Aurantimonas sp. CSK15Z-1]MCQ8783703.1 peptidase S10 [Aurantimonas sp. CSK15Z-1]